MFGHVALTVNRHKQSLYALKSITLEKINTYGLYENLILERTISLQLDHSMIIKLVKTYKDTKRVYFLLEYARGLDLFDVLREMDTVQE